MDNYPCFHQGTVSPELPAFPTVPTDLPKLSPSLGEHRRFCLWREGELLETLRWKKKGFKKMGLVMGSVSSFQGNWPLFLWCRDGGGGGREKQGRNKSEEEGAGCSLVPGNVTKWSSTSQITSSSIGTPQPMMSSALHSYSRSHFRQALQSYCV